MGLLCMLVGCGDSKRDAIGTTEVRIETTEGDIVVRLYDDTPLHRDNFIANVRAGRYDGILFNRIVPEMVIQAGDTSLLLGEVTSRSGTVAGRHDAGLRSDAAGDAGAAVASSSVVDGVPAEIVYPRHFHKQGALAAAREADSINPSRLSSPLQWYIVTGKKYSGAELRELQGLLYEGRVSALFESLQRRHSAELDSLRAADRAAWQRLLNDLQVEAENSVAANPPQPFTDAQKQVYAKVGGAPHLDGGYTVFGEVVEGMPIALRIGRTPVDAHERPRRPVGIKRIVVE